jgi:hypothetical protein
MPKSKSNANHFYNQVFDTGKYQSASKGKGRAKKKAYFSDGSDALANIKKQFVSFLHVPSDNSVFFKAFIIAYNETYNSTWKSEQVFGRADQIHSFVQTGRQIQLSLAVPAASESEAFENLSKVQKLIQFLYPNYEHIQEAQTISQGPLVRLKIMNLLQDMSDAGSAANATRQMSNEQYFASYQSRGTEPQLGTLGFISSLTVNHNLENRDAGVFEKINQTSAATGLSPELGGSAAASSPVPNTILPKNIELVISFTPIHEHALGWDNRNRFGSTSRDVGSRKAGELFPYGVVTTAPATDRDNSDMTSEDARARAEEEAKTQQQKDDAEARYGGMFGRARYNRDKNRLTKRGDKMHPDDKAYIERAQAGYEQMDKN